ncbi:MAG: SUMF1/EgtB/PvdO family nonheme iron enzyme [Anaerolineales bacterium]|nr:SUMF1/EgtB/PvdO family nonheme iron enzyme [Anaerolineales bacterium]
MEKRPLKVFLCHASADKPKVRELYRTLRRRGVQPWLDVEDLIPGQNWEMEIPKALLSSDAIIICLSPNSVDKEGYVQKEIKFALDKALEMPEGRIFLIPARLEDCDLPFTLRQYQAVNLFEKDGYTKLMKALKLRASQLHLANVELPKAGEITREIEKIADDKRPPEPKEAKPETETPKPSTQKIDVGGDVSDSVIVTGSNNVINVGTQETPSPKPEKEKAAEPVAKKEQPKKSQPPRKPNTAIIVALIGLVGTICAALVSSPLLANLFDRTPEPTAIISTTTATKTPAPSKTPTKVFTPTATPYPIEIIDPKGITMRLVPAGEFSMGSENGSDDERPVHPVYLDAFYMDVYEVTNAAYQACVDVGACDPPQETSSYTRSSYYENSEFDNYPVIDVDWNQAKAYCAWRGGGLPTEAQWEKAARGDDGRTYPWGEEVSCNQANYHNGSNYCVGDTTEVGNYENGKSPYGMYDMAGNVWEWVNDWYDSDYYASSPSSNPSGPVSGQYRVLRGGAWDYLVVNLVRSAFRNRDAPDGIYNGIGFRCARSLP